MIARAANSGPASIDWHARSRPSWLSGLLPAVAVVAVWLPLAHLELALIPVSPTQRFFTESWQDLAGLWRDMVRFTRPAEDPAWWPYALSLAQCALAAILGQACVQVAAARVGLGRNAPAATHLRLNVYAGLAGLALLPGVCLLVLCLAISLPHSDAFRGTSLLIPSVLLAVLTMAIARSVRRHELRWRWRPACPECGYDIRRSIQPRCAECGEPFPTESRSYRRWAVRRLAWDRVSGAGLLLDYSRTVATIAVRPADAARRLAIPDRLRRATTWALVHAIACVLLLTAMRERVDLVWWSLYWTGTPQERQQMAWHRRVELASTASRVGWPLMVTVPAVACMPAIGCGLAWLLPRRHPAARRAGLKWSLYLVALPFWVFAVGATCYLAYLAQNGSVSGGMLGAEWEWPRAPLYGVAFALYGLWWCVGMNAHPYEPRGWGRLAAYAASFVGACVLLYYVVLPPWLLIELY